MYRFDEKYINPLTDFGFKKLFEAAEIAKFSPMEREAYEESLKYYRDLKNVVDTSKEEGWVEGREEGRIEGREEGLIEGREEGKEEKTLEFARKMKLNNEAIEKIMAYTQLSRETIEKL
ncbi:MAG: PD-(D/E)XK nuclease family transposase [Chitinophagales bacterium]|nr:hypothetical protein [Bacteroidota bacterium]MCB9043799.1 hypothetical protein [Chitinophagales bacterium]